MDAAADEDRGGPPQHASRRVLVVSAGMGAGHDMAAAELVRRLRDQGHVARSIDVLELGRPGQGERLKQIYARLLRWSPWLYDLVMRLWTRWPNALDRFIASRARAYEEGLCREVGRFAPDVVVSVFSLSSQALGRLRASGRLTVPVVTYVTDPGPHPYWIHPAVDLYLTMLPETAHELASSGARRTLLVSPLVRPPFWQGSAPRAEVRRRLGFPPDARIALVSAGYWAVGGVERTADRLLRAGTVVPVTLCGRDEALRARLARRGAGIPLGWTGDMASLMAAADVLVDNAGGLTCWEALVSGLPVVLFHPLPGHGRLNATALVSAGLAAWARTDDQLGRVVASIGDQTAEERVAPPSALVRGDPVSAVLNVRAGTPVSPAA